ncbi:hypothetical protein OEZ85_003957 [Tetradesmus obliquus]|uniref:Peptidase S8/S53 domain-containing protein n=1 Tax=Tetradesmus obliquus TaxID=3088 RepID=A0ABY8UDR5_TETOB|nr:hypothetical protein OEZ85_003957 [Tetradesmus obliquus]
MMREQRSTASAKIVWSGRSCGDGSKIQYTQMRAVDAATGKTLRIQGTPCITRFDPQRVTWSRQRFGKCGSAPLQVPALPTRICSATGGNPGSFISGPTPANPNPASPQQPPAASPAPDGDQQDPNGSSTAAPDLQEAASPSPLPDAADASPSPAPFTRSGLLLPRVPLSAGDSAPSGVQRIEAATPDGVDNTEGLPVEQQVTVGVIDSGVDRTHPDINYAGGQSFTAADANADQDAYGHGTHVAGIIGAKNNGQGVVGVSPGAPVYSLKVLDGQGRGSMSGVIAAVSWVATEGVKQGIRVINLSLATMVDPKSEEYAATVDAVCGVFAQAEAAGVFVAVAAGNYGDALRGYLPAACPSVAAVTAVDETGSAAASFSNFLEVNGATPEDQARIIAAPGTKIRSTISFAKDSTGYRGKGITAGMRPGAPEQPLQWMACVTASCADGN